MEYWSEYVQSCPQIAKDYNLTIAKKLQYLHNVPSKDVHRFYSYAVQPCATTI